MTIMKHTIIKPVLFPIAAATLVASALCPLASNAATDRTARRIQVDPDTGEIVKPSAETPPQPAAGGRSQPSRRAKSEDRDGPRAWTTDDGVQMMTPDPDDAPKAQATACPDGSLHIGDASPHSDDNAQDALCAEDQ